MPSPYLDQLLTVLVSAAGSVIAKVGGANGGGLTFLAPLTATANGSTGNVDVGITASATVPATRTLTAGAGHTVGSGGDLSADRSFIIGANADGSILVNAHDVQVGVLATDAQHGARGGGNLHNGAVAGGANGFLTGTDKAKLDGITAGAAVASVGATSPLQNTGSATAPVISLTTVVPANLGGTALSGPGNNGNVLYSNGSAWLSSNASVVYFSLDVTLTGGTATLASGKDLTNAVVISVRLKTATTATGDPVVTFVAGANGNVTVTSYTAGAIQAATDASKYTVVFAGAV